MPRQFKERRDWARSAFTAISLVMSLIMFLVMVYAVYTCNKLSPIEKQRQCFKEWTYVERN